MKAFFKLRLFFSLLLISFGGSTTVNAEENADSAQLHTSNYVRLLKDEKDNEAVALQTSIEHFSGKDLKGPYRIDLVSAVHIAEDLYYKELNNQFRGYDAVLFELIADSSLDREQVGKPSDHPLSLAQKTLQSMLGLTFQLEEIDYKAPNFVHADMTPQQFSSSMQLRGESVSELLLKVMLSSMANSEGRAPPDLSDIIMLGFAKHRTIGFRRALARQFQDMETMITAINGSEGSTILSERNKVALAVALNQLAEGKRSIAIFYGAAHMPDMKKQLQSELKVESSGLEWLTAWNLKTQD